MNEGPCEIECQCEIGTALQLEARANMRINSRQSSWTQVSENDMTGYYVDMIALARDNVEKSTRGIKEPFKLNKSNFKIKPFSKSEIVIYYYPSRHHDDQV